MKKKAIVIIDLHMVYRGRYIDFIIRSFDHKQLGRYCREIGSKLEWTWPLDVKVLLL